MGWQRGPNGVEYGTEEGGGSWNTAGVRWNTDGDGWSSRIEYGQRTHAGRSLPRGYITCLGPTRLCGRPLIWYCAPPAAFELLPPADTGSY